MSFQFRPAVRQAIPLLVGVSGGTGSGKTMSAMLLARGMSDGKKFAVIDTEASRAKHYADKFSFDHGDLTPPFTPARYLEAIKAAESAGYPVVIVDSSSHEHAGDGGLLDMHEAELQRMAGDDWKRREACAMAAWVKPKAQHKSFVSHLLQLRCHLVLCFRAEPKVEVIKDPETGKTKIVPKKSLTGLDGWIPICEKNLPYELTASFLLTCDAPGIPRPIKLQEQHRAFFPLDRPISEEAGRLLAQWAKGSTAQSPVQSASQPSVHPVIQRIHRVMDHLAAKGRNIDALVAEHFVSRKGPLTLKLIDGLTDERTMKWLGKCLENLASQHEDDLADLITAQPAVQPTEQAASELF